LELLVDVVILGDGAAAVGTDIGERRFESLLDGFRRRRWPMRVLAMLLASFSSRFLGLRLWLAFGERSRLPLAGAFEFVEAFF